MDSAIQPSMPAGDDAIVAAPLAPLQPRAVPNLRQDPSAGLLSATILSVFFHALMWLPFLLCLLLVVPKFKKIFEDFQMKLPLATETLITLSDIALGLWFFLPLPLMLLLALDGAIVYALRRRSSTAILAWLWSALWLMAAMAAMGVVVVALFQPLLLLMEGLSK
jgi:hypothetical protein